MAGKRTATSDLNHDNWDREDAPEEAGTFQRASEESLKKRVIKTAKRRNPISSVRENEDSEKKSAFAGFTGFNKPLTPTNNAFSFLSSNSTAKTETTKVNGFQNKRENSTENKESTPGKSILLSTSTSTQEKTEKSDDYYSKLKGLNESVSKWIKQHVDANPFINLQPIFRDYEKYFKDLENGKEEAENKIKETAKKKAEAVSSMSNFVFKAVETVPDSTTGKSQEENKRALNSKPQFSFGSASVTTTKPSFGFSSSGSSPATSSFSFVGATTSSTAATTQTSTSSMFSFGSGSTATIPSFSFTASTPISFGAPPPTTSTEDSNKEDAEANDEPPKVEFTPVVEKDHLYTTRCKMFVKKEKEFTDRGVGNLYIKSIENSEKVQVILRADTNLGNLLCNFILSEGIPLTRVGKKDVMLVCLPSPESKPPPVPVLFRVKSPEEADTLFETFNKYKK